jgi:predicted nucleic acid-binding protein
LVNAKLSKAEMALELEKANHVIERKNMQEEIRDLKEKLAAQSQDMKAMKEELVDFVKKQLLEFEEKLRVEAMP